MAYVTTFVAGNAAYVLHAGAGVQGGGAGDRAHGRPANIQEVPRLAETLNGIRAAKSYLPPGLANWMRTDPPFEGFDPALQDQSIAGALTATSDGRFVVAVLGLRRPLTIRARTAMTIAVRDPVTGSVVKHQELRIGQPITLDGGDSFILIGEALRSSDD